jgi:plasmid stabilization system protein ParE
MKLVYSRRALADIEQIGTYYSTHASPAIARAVQTRFIEVIERIRRAPQSAPRVSQRSEVRVVSVVRYPFRIFYRGRSDTIDIRPLDCRPESVHDVPEHPSTMSPV